MTGISPAWITSRSFSGEPSLVIGFRNTLIYATVSASLKVVLGFLLAAFLTSELRTRGFLRSLIYFPNIVSTDSGRHYVQQFFFTLQRASSMSCLHWSASTDQTGSVIRASHCFRSLWWMCGREWGSRW